MSKRKGRIPEHYTTIDEMPIWAWWMVHEKNNLSYICKKSPGIKLTPFQTNALYVVWKQIKDQFIDTFGLGENALAMLRLRKEIACMEIEMHLSKDGSIQTFIDVKYWELKQYQKEQDGGDDYIKTKGYVEKFMGFRLDPKSVTVHEYYSYLQIMDREARAREKLLIKKKRG